MSKTRKNHYVPQWHQREFLEVGQTELHYLDLKPNQHRLPNGQYISGKSKFQSPTARCFVETDLYSTFFGSVVDDEIERRLFGKIDTEGAQAIQAFTKTDKTEWHRHFETLFKYIDIQRLRTPRGLEWLRTNYPRLHQNELMVEMQALRIINCSTWAGGVREIVSAEDVETKFLLSDHPVTIFNHALPPSSPLCAGPNDPSIDLKGSQTIFPLNRNFCLILTNLEYAEQPETDPIGRRTGAKNYRSSMTRTDAFIHSRRLSTDDVICINHVIKNRARRYIAAGRKEWLYPEEHINVPWNELRQVFLPPADELFLFGGEIVVGFDDGRSQWQDKFGRTEPEWDTLIKTVPSHLRNNDFCGCGSERRYAVCCKTIPTIRRPSWSVLSIRERNQALERAIIHILGLDGADDWANVRRMVTDEKIKEIYGIFAAFWPRDTDLLALLPKPDGRPRAVYSGHIHPDLILEFAAGACLTFGQTLIPHPFDHPGSLNPEFSPTENPHLYRQEFLKSVMFFLRMMPLIETGSVILYPDPWTFDTHLRDTTMEMAKQRARFINFDPSEDPRLQQIFEDEHRRAMFSLPPSHLISKIKRTAPDTGISPKDVLKYMHERREDDPFASLQDPPIESGKRGGLLLPMKLQPNLEMMLYLAQATGASIVTDSPHRWKELKHVAGSCPLGWQSHLVDLQRSIETSVFTFPWDPLEVASMAEQAESSKLPDLMSATFRYLTRVGERGLKPNREKQLTAGFGRAHASMRAIYGKSASTTEACISCLFPVGGIQSNSVNRLLLMSGSEHHLQSAPMAFFVDRNVEAND